MSYRLRKCRTRARFQYEAKISLVFCPKVLIKPSQTSQLHICLCDFSLLYCLNEEIKLLYAAFININYFANLLVCMYWHAKIGKYIKLINFKSNDINAHLRVRADLCHLLIRRFVKGICVNYRIPVEIRRWDFRVKY